MVVPENTGVYINDFMFDLDLKGFELLAYALIYSYSANGNKQGYYGSCETMAKRLHTTRQRINIVLNSLAEKKLVVKHEIFVNKMKLCVYQINYNYEKPQGVIETVTGCHRNDDRGVIETMHNNILNNINNNINSNSSEPNGSSEFTNDESTRVSEDSDTTLSSSTTEEKKVVPSSEKEFWDDLGSLETSKTEPKAEKKPRNYFKVPTIGEITQYISENNYLVDAEGFYHYYRDRNWCAGRKKIDWKDKVRQWDLDRRAKGKSYGYKKQPASPYNLDIKNQSFSEENWK